MLSKWRDRTTIKPVMMPKIDNHLVALSEAVSNEEIQRTRATRIQTFKIIEVWNVQNVIRVALGFSRY